jgi:hypothetical protein
MQLRGQMDELSRENTVFVIKIYYELNSTLGNKYAG